MRIEKTKGKGEPDKEGKSNDKGGRRQGQKKGKPQPKSYPKKPEPDISLIKIQPVLTVKELAEKLHRSGADVVKALMKIGTLATVNQEIDFDTAVKVGMNFNVLVEEAVEIDLFEQAFSEEGESSENLVERPPVVVVMGHVDHGKTSLLDAIRNSRVTATEAGGITQKIGAYTVAINNKAITFIDTPGHEAFTAMRMRGAQVTDIAVLVVAADDGVMPQTVEAINHAKAAKVDIIVAINKIDKQGSNPDRVKQELTEHGLLVEDWGGDTIAVEVSALKKTGLDHLLEMINIVSEMKELKANPTRPARGTIIEAQLDKGRGPVATVLVQNGTLNVGDTVIAGACFGRIRAMVDDKGKNVKSAGPSTPVEILGLSDVPMAGDAFYVAQNEKQARMLSDSVIAKGRVSLIKEAPKATLDALFTQIKAGQVKELKIIVKADVQGSAEAVKTSLEKITNDEVRIKIIHSAVGAVNESDVMLASASNAIIIGFNVRPDPTAKSVAENEKVDIRLYRVIYNAIEDVTAAMKGMLDPVFREKVIGHAEIRQLFKASGVGTIGGSYVTDGKITRTARVRVIRDGKVVYDGTLDTLKRFKDDVREVNSGFECGMLFAKFNDIKENDIAEAYVMEEIPR
jgi:translation initiation factor IF-2